MHTFAHILLGITKIKNMNFLQFDNVKCNSYTYGKLS